MCFIKHENSDTGGSSDISDTMQCWSVV